MNIISCLTAEHELKYIVASWLICCVGSILFVKLMSRARSSSVATKMNWIVLAGIVGGSTIWTTHFIALAGYFPSVTHLFDPSMAAGTLIFSIILMMAAVGVFSLKIGGWYPQVAGTIIGMGMSGVHGLGMIPYQIQATVEWDIALFITSIAMAAEFGMVATTLLDQPLRRRRIHIAMLSIMLALLSAHFVPMASMTLVPDPNIFPPVIMMKDSILMLIVFTIISLLLICGWVFYRIDIRSAHEARSRLQHLEHHDLLTGLANRTGIGRALEYSINEAAKDGSSRAVLYFDIRRFRNINDVYGYAAGDDILQIVSRRIVSASGANAVVARVGGDEFVATMKCESIAEVLEFSQKLHSVISKPFIWHSTPLVVETDIGISIYPGDGKTPEMLLSKASMAMVRARNDGVNIAYHDLNRDEAVRSMSELAFDLRYAIERGEFELYYQRQNNVATGDLVGFEALLRWHHPKRGMIAPSDFIPIAETYGYIANIGEWVLRTACMEATRWPHPYKIAVNVASSELSNPHLPDIVADALASSGLDASRLELEMTETGIIDDPSQTRRIIDRLKGVGVSLAMDDYGTGNSSLSTLQSYPFDKIKIDKSFVTRVCTDPQAAAIVHSTVILGKSLKIPILAEGVETECALKYLRQVGCNEVQGFLFGKPMPAGAIRELVA